MVLLKRRKSVAVDGERTEKGILAFPRFYIKAVTGSFSVYHRLTHSYIGSFRTEEELEVALTDLAEKTEEEVWTGLVKSRTFSLTSLTGAIHSKFTDEREDWYFGAWGVYTTRFYDNHPHLFTEVKSAPMHIINRVRSAIMEEQKKEHERHKAEIERIERGYKEENKAPKPPKAVPTIIKEETPTPPPVKEPKKIKRIRLPKPVNPFA